MSKSKHSTRLKSAKPWPPLAFVLVFAAVGSYLLFHSFAATPSTYDSTILADHPVAFWDMDNPGGIETDLTGNDHNGTYKGGAPALVNMPNGNQAVEFNGSNEYMTVPSSNVFSIPTTGQLTWEGWIRPDTLQQPNSSSDGYVDWMGKCQNYSPSCEWEARMYNTTNPQDRCNRLSAYAFNNTAGLGSGADWQPNCGLLEAGQWLNVVGEYQTQMTPAGCSSAYPGTLNIWVNGVEWDQAAHSPTGCMSQYDITPTASTSPLTIGTMAMDTWFEGAVGKVAIYNYLLSQSQINAHFTAMTGAPPSGSCATSCAIPMPTQTGSQTPPPDTTPPAVSLSTPASGATVSGDLTISGTSSDSVGVSKVELYVDSQLVATDTNSPYTFSIDTTKYANGSHSLYLEAFDTAGNHADSATTTVRVNNTAPGSGDSSGGSGSSSGGVSPITTAGPSSSTKPLPVSGDLTIKPATSDSVTVKVDGKPISRNTVNTSQLTNGVHTLTITEDGKTKTQAITVHNSLPVALRNYLRVHRVLYISSVSFVLVAFLTIYFNRRLFLRRLLPLVDSKKYMRFGRSMFVKPKR